MYVIRECPSPTLDLSLRKVYDLPILALKNSKKIEENSNMTSTRCDVVKISRKGMGMYLESEFNLDL